MSHHITSKNELFKFKIITKVKMYNECTFYKINVQCTMYQSNLLIFSLTFRFAYANCIFEIPVTTSLCQLNIRKVLQKLELT